MDLGRRSRQRRAPPRIVRRKVALFWLVSCRTFLIRFSWRVPRVRRRPRWSPRGFGRRMAQRSRSRRPSGHQAQAPGGWQHQGRDEEGAAHAPPTCCCSQSSGGRRRWRGPVRGHQCPAQCRVPSSAAPPPAPTSRGAGQRRSRPRQLPQIDASQNKLTRLQKLLPRPPAGSLTLKPC